MLKTKLKLINSDISYSLDPKKEKEKERKKEKKKKKAKDINI